MSWLNNFWLSRKRRWQGLPRRKILDDIVGSHVGRDIALVKVMRERSQRVRAAFHLASNYSRIITQDRVSLMFLSINLWLYS